jgi:hypothetical protein
VLAHTASLSAISVVGTSIDAGTSNLAQYEDLDQRSHHRSSIATQQVTAPGSTASVTSS